MDSATSDWKSRPRWRPRSRSAPTAVPESLWIWRSGRRPASLAPSVFDLSDEEADVLPTSPTPSTCDSAVELLDRVFEKDEGLFAKGQQLHEYPHSINDKPALGFHIQSQTSYFWIDTADQLGDVISRTMGLPLSPPSIYIDVQGPQLGRHGNISILTLYLRPLKSVYLIDIRNLGPIIGRRTEQSATTLKDVLESETIPKIIFDGRSASDALYSLHNIDLKGVHEIQLLELATRRNCSKKYLNGILKCAERDGRLAPEEKELWMDAQRLARETCHPAFGGSDRALNERPLDFAVIYSMVQNVTILGDLWDVYRDRLSATNEAMVADATAERLQLAKAERYEGQGPHMALGPWPWWQSLARPPHQGRKKSRAVRSDRARADRREGRGDPGLHAK